MIKINEYQFSRKAATGYAIIIGSLIGLINTLYAPIDFSLSWLFLGWLAAAIVSVVFLHEMIHGTAAVLIGYRPIFGFKLPLVYVTFNEKIPRGHFITIALAPLVILDLLFGVLFAMGVLKVFSYFCLIINTLGAIGDMWITIKLVPQERGTLIQDTKSGIEVWKMSPSRTSINN
jgi:hypothetical protein